MIYELFFNYYSKLLDICGEALRLSRAKSNMNTWERIRNNNEYLIKNDRARLIYLFIRIKSKTQFKVRTYYNTRESLSRSEI